MGYKEETMAAYDKHARAFEERSKGWTREYIKEDIGMFLDNLKGKKILDLGSGPGRDVLFFKEKGLVPVCVDNSLVMVDLCKQKGLQAYQMDMEDLNFPAGSFDGVWAYASLQHIPKDKLKTVLKKIKKILPHDGVFFLGMKEGEGEGFIEDSNYPGSRRFHAFYKDEELKEMLTEEFEILHTSSAELNNKSFLHYLCKVKS